MFVFPHFPSQQRRKMSAEDGFGDDVAAAASSPHPSSPSAMMRNQGVSGRPPPGSEVSQTHPRPCLTSNTSSLTKPTIIHYVEEDELAAPFLSPQKIVFVWAMNL